MARPNASNIQVNNGTDGDDIIVATAAVPARFRGGLGNDTLSANDSLFGTALDDTLIGGAGDDLLFGGRGNNVLRGLDGDDTLSGSGLLKGGNGDDGLQGSGRLDGGAGNDGLLGFGNATLIGGDGADRFVTGDSRSLSRILDFDAAEGDTFFYSVGFDDVPVVDPFAEGFLRVIDGEDGAEVQSREFGNLREDDPFVTIAILVGLTAEEIPLSALV